MGVKVDDKVLLPQYGGNEVTIQNSQITFSNLIDTNTYDFTFFASRLSVSDNRETLYELIGQNTDSKIKYTHTWSKYDYWGKGKAW